MKHFINDVDEIVNEALLGLCTDPALTLLDSFPDVRVVCQRHWQNDTVAVISGGGSGHEPAHAGFVGEGMLAAAVCGNIFASPSVDAVLSAILAVGADNGCLLVVKNYTGDRLNFGLAAEQAREMGVDVEVVIVGDDVALGRDVQQRGIAGTLFVHKIAGYYAAEGASLQQVKQHAQHAADNIYSIGLALTDVQQFGGDDDSRLTDGQAELGLGIHGEPGASVIDMASATDLMNQAAEKLHQLLPEEDVEYALLLNNLGSVSPIEMQVLQHCFHQLPIAQQVSLAVQPGQLMTSLNMKGFSISLLALKNDEWRTALQAPTAPAAWQVFEYGSPSHHPAPELPETFPFEPSSNDDRRPLLQTAARTLQKMKADLNTMDKKVGDGDAGTTFATVGQALEARIDDFPYANLHELLITVGRLLGHEAGGSSGVLLSMFFTAAGNNYKTSQNIGTAFTAGINRMKEMGGAEPGDRTMIDALQPAIEALAEGQSLEKIAARARKGADETAEIAQTSAGRSSYLSENDLAGINDPGAEMVARVLQAISKGA